MSLQKTILNQPRLLTLLGDCYLNLPYIMLKNGQTYFKNLAVSTPQDFKNMFGHFLTLCMKGLNDWLYTIVSKILLQNKVSILWRSIFNPFTATRFAFCNPYGGVKTISKEYFPYVTQFSKNFVGHWWPSGWKRLFFPFHYELSNRSGKSSKALIDL